MIAPRAGFVPEGEIHAQKNAPPMPMNRPRYTASFAAHRSEATAGAVVFSMSGIGPAPGAPIEKTTDPPTGWPSRETTRQLNTCVPFGKPGGASTTRAALRLAGFCSVILPLAVTSRTTSGATGSLNVSVN